MRTRIVSEPQFAAETAALLDAAEPGPRIADEGSLRAARDEPSDPELSLECDPQVRAADLYLPARGGPVLIRLYRPLAANAPGPLLLWLHGGGFIGGSVTDLDYPCSRLALEAGLTVVSLEYRLAPEHPYPAALHDTSDALRWLHDHGPLIGGDGRVAAGGQSAGAALVAGACLAARDEDAPMPALQVLCYPWLDAGATQDSGGMSMDLGWAAGQYLAGQPATPYAAPLRAASLAGAAPAVIIGAGRDVLLEDARGYAGRLDADGVDVSYVEYADTPHAFLNFCGVLSAGQHALSLIAAELTRAYCTRAAIARAHSSASV